MKKILLYLLLLTFFLNGIFARSPPPIPPTPAVYYGLIQASCNINGAELQAYINNELRGRIDIICINDTFCKFGGPSLSENKLIVPGNLKENNSAKVEFYIHINGNKVKVGENTFVIGKMEKLNFILTPNQCRSLFPTTPPQPLTDTTIISKETRYKNIEKTLKELGIKDVVEDKYGIQNITDVKVVFNITIEVKPKKEELLSRPEIKKALEKIKEGLSKSLNEDIKIEIEPVEATVTIELIKIKMKTGDVVYLTKIEKVIEDADRVIEIIPKDLIETVDDLIWIKGVNIKVLEVGSIFEIVPENHRISYIIKGNKTGKINEIFTVKYIYEVIKKSSTEENITSIIQPQPAKPKQNISKTEQNITQSQNISVSRTKRSNIGIFVILVVLVVAMVGAFLYITKKEEEKKEEEKKEEEKKEEEKKEE